MRALPLEPPKETVAIGYRLRAVRQAQQLTIDNVAAMTGLTMGFLSRVERDMASPSAASLVALCQVLSVSVGSLFEPRLADIGSARFWRTDRTADYGPLNGLARHQINANLIATHWDDLLRVAGSLATGTVNASELPSPPRRRPTHPFGSRDR